MSLVDFSVARQCWQAAHWSLLVLQRGFVESDETEAFGASFLRTLVPELTIYGVDRVVPVMVYPVYEWLYRAHAAVIREIAAYYKADIDAENVLQSVLHESALGMDRISEALLPQALSMEWQWINHFWQSHDDCLAYFVLTVSELQAQLPGLSWRGKVAPQARLARDLDLINLSAYNPSMAQGKRNALNVNDDNILLSVREIPAWDPVIAASRVDLVQALLVDIGERWVES